MSKLQTGDTIIEVLLGVTLFSMVAVSALTIMNRGMAVAQRSLEITLVRQHIDAQAEMLQYIHHKANSGRPEYAAVWNNLPKNDVAKEVIGSGKKECPTNFSNGEFALRPTAGSIARVSRYLSPATYAQQSGEDSYGLGVQLVRVEGGRAYDAYIQACWYTPSSSVPMTIGTIVRLYDPKV